MQLQDEPSKERRNWPFDEGDDSPPTAPVWSSPPTRVRYQVLWLLCILSFILYLDRICISQAVSSIERSLGISHTAMGFILGAFTLAYGLFEVPTGHWGDRYGSRGVLTRIVVWWSIFTMLTGAAFGFGSLLVVRFLFGAGEAGALPNAARVVARWFPPGAQGRAQGIVITSALVGGAISPVIAQYLIFAFGWRLAFVALGVPGILWAIAFHHWFRDNPAEHPAVSESERHYITDGVPAAAHAEHPALPWGRVLVSANVWLLGAIISCGSFTTYMFFSWYPTYLERGRGVSSAQSGWLASLVLAGGAVGSILGGFLSDWLIRRTGERRWTRSGLGCFALSSAAVAMIASIHVDSPVLAAACASCACLCVHLHVAPWWGVVTDISGKHLGALFGLMNSMGVPGAVASQLFLGHFADWLHDLGYQGRDQWDPAFWIYAGILILGGVFWLFVNSARSVVERQADLATQPE